MVIIERLYKPLKRSPHKRSDESLKIFGNFRNTMETIFWLVKQSKELSADAWNDPIKLWSGCNQYVFDRLKDNMRDANALEAIRRAVKTEELI